MYNTLHKKAVNARFHYVGFSVQVAKIVIRKMSVKVMRIFVD